MKKNKNTATKIIDFVIFLILIVVLYFAYKYYQKNNFNEFIRSETNPYTSKFVRDDEQKYSERASYKIQSNEFNDAMFYKIVMNKKILEHLEKK